MNSVQSSAINSRGPASHCVKRPGEGGCRVLEKKAANQRGEER